jgi:hypothetical protein
MTPDALAAALQRLHGRRHGWLRRASEALGVGYDSLRHMVAGRRPVPPGLAAEVMAALAEAPAPNDAAAQLAAAWELFGEQLEAHGAPAEVALSLSGGSPAAKARLRARFEALGIRVSG